MANQTTIRFKFQLGRHEYMITDRMQVLVGGLRVVFADSFDAMRFLKPLLSDEAALARLRRRLPLESDGDEPLDDQHLVVEVAKRLMLRKLVLWRLQPVLSDKAEKVLARFQQKLEKQMQISARDLLNPDLQTVEGHPFLKQIPPEKVLDALKELFMDLPMGDSAIGRELIEWLESTPAGRGRDLANMSPKELMGDIGDQAGDWVKRKVDNLKEEHPALFWSLAAAALVGAGALTYAQGTEILGKVGVKPEIKHEFFDGMLTMSGKLEFAPELKDPKITLDGRGRFADGKVEVGAGTTLSGEDFGSLRPDEYHADARLRHGNSQLRGSINLEGDGDVKRWGVDGSHTWKDVGPLDRLSATGGYERNYLTDSERITGGLSGAADDYNFSVRGSHDLRSGGSSVVGDFGKDIMDGRGRISGFVEQTFGGPNGSDTRGGVLFQLRF